MASTNLALPALRIFINTGSLRVAFSRTCSTTGERHVFGTPASGPSLPTSVGGSLSSAPTRTSEEKYSWISKCKSEHSLRDAHLALLDLRKVVDEPALTAHAPSLKPFIWQSAHDPAERSPLHYALL